MITSRFLQGVAASCRMGKAAGRPGCHRRKHTAGRHTRRTAPCLRWLVLVALSLCLARPAAAWPDRPVQLIVPFPAGGVIDIVARGFAQALTDRLGVAVAVVNRDGASGAIGGRALATTRPDGHVLGFFSAGAITTQPLIVRNVGYTLASFQPLCQVFSGGYVLVAGRGGPASAAAAIEQARREPGLISFGYGGNGTPPHWALLGLERSTGARFNAVPFRGDPPLVTALLGGDIALGILSTGSAVSASLPALLSFGAERARDLPAVPTAHETGVPIQEAVFGGLIAPAGLPAAVAQRLEAACDATIEDPRVSDTLRAARLDATPADARGFTAALERDVAAKRELARLAGLLVE